jgi:predicted TIM-barrel enzyme
LKELGFAGIQNFPTVGLVDGKLRQNLEETGISYQQEVEVVALAREMDLLTTPYVFDEQETQWMTEAGADILVAHMGCTTGGTIGVSTATPLDECVEKIRGMVGVARKIRKDVLVLCHGGPLATPDDAEYVFTRVKGIDGFYGASSMERLPTEIAMTKQIRDFVGLELGGKR